MPVGTSGILGKGMKRAALQSGSQSSRSHEAEDRFGGLAEWSLSAPLGGVLD